MNEIKSFSPKQKLILTWWSKKQYENFNAIICDGAIRSGKTVCMSISFILWAFSNFNNENFAICGKTIGSVKRNVVSPLVKNLKSLGFCCQLKISENKLKIKFKKKINTFYLFGGKDEASASNIQGLTLAGILLDEVVLMPQSFVEQALARCSVENSKFWFNCNPKNPFHWFYCEWIKKSKEKNTLYLHLTLKDNPSLSKKIIERYEKLYSGVFYDRFIKGIWTAANGQVYPMFSEKEHVVENLPEKFERYVVSCDYGIINPTSFGLWGKYNNKWFRIREFYYDSKLEKSHKTDEEYYKNLKILIENSKIDCIVVDPSASSFIECVKRHNEFKIVKAKNDVLAGISLVSDALLNKNILFHKSCVNSIREFFLYCWNENKNFDSVKKENDHAMDDIRYFVSTILHQTENCFHIISSMRKI